MQKLAPYAAIVLVVFVLFLVMRAPSQIPLSYEVFQQDSSGTRHGTEFFQRMNFEVYDELPSQIILQKYLVRPPSNKPLIAAPRTATQELTAIEKLSGEGRQFKIQESECAYHPGQFTCYERGRLVLSYRKLSSRGADTVWATGKWIERIAKHQPRSCFCV